jgi:hypothetical protein
VRPGHRSGIVVAGSLGLAACSTEKTNDNLDAGTSTDGGVFLDDDHTTGSIATESAFFALANKVWGPKPESVGNRLWVQTQEPICAGIIAGAALIGIGDVLVKVFLLG